MNDLLELSNIKKTYPGVTALDDLGPIRTHVLEWPIDSADIVLYCG
jgi:hypothetical protein